MVRKTGGESKEAFQSEIHKRNDGQGRGSLTVVRTIGGALGEASLAVIRMTDSEGMESFQSKILELGDSFEEVVYKMERKPRSAEGIVTFLVVTSVPGHRFVWDCGFAVGTSHLH